MLQKEIASDWEVTLDPEKITVENLKSTHRMKELEEIVPGGWLHLYNSLSFTASEKQMAQVCFDHFRSSFDLWTHFVLAIDY